MNAQERRRIHVRSASEVVQSEEFAKAREAGQYQGYTYSYPHKTAYRWFDEPVPLEQVWQTTSLDSAFLYAHVPFCEMRCGFCNLFTTTDQSSDREQRFIAAFERQAKSVRASLGDLRITSGAIGGGTPTLLSAQHLSRVFAALATTYNVDFSAVPFSVETSPETADDEKVAVLAANNVHRVSIGIQSWFASELRGMGRPQDVNRAHEAVNRLRASTIAKLNIDLIYGVEGQTIESMKSNIAQTLAHEPDEVFLYPLYVRPLTGLGRNTRREWDDDRVTQYRVGRDALLEAGFAQVSMRRFERHNSSNEIAGIEYDCQSDPMIGLGPGARSYSATTHYSSDWAVGRSGVGSIIDEFIDAPDAHHQHAHYGLRLSRDDQQRRFILQGLLHVTGVDVRRYTNTFGTSPFDDFAALSHLVDAGLASAHADVIKLSVEGFELSDVIGPWFYAPEVVQKMSDFEIR
jgi:oxygen-independent coproporphyrinogen III oxidase